MELVKTTNYLPMEGLLPGYQFDIVQFNRYVSDKLINQSTITAYFDSMREQGLFI